MVNSAKLREWTTSALESLNKYEWYQQIKARWEELDHQSKIYFRFAGFGFAFLMVIITLLSSIWSVHSLKVELSEKRSLLNTIQSANDEMRRLRDAAPNADQAARDGGPWSSYFETIATTAGVDKDNIVVSSEKAGTSSDQTKEALFDVTLKHVNIKQVVRYAFSVENGQRPVKLRNLQIDTKGDTTGYLEATLALSAFTQVEPK